MIQVSSCKVDTVTFVDLILSPVLTPCYPQVLEIDGRQIGDGEVGPVTKQLQAAYSKLAESEGEVIPFR